ncbi:MAG: hypothetical protein GY765_33185 [bacterium]|nr:hypothetical protein [bacterium]
MDFTVKIYRTLLETFLEKGYKFLTFQDFLGRMREGIKEDKKIVVMRHDVDRRPNNSLETAKLEHELGIKASYFFRIVPESYHPEIIKEIVGFGHELGYHYEDLSLTLGDVDKAIESFKANLAVFRDFYPVNTACMHGSPTSRYDNRDVWKKYKYTDYGVIGEPYYDLDFSKMLYLTDTGRCWNGDRVSVRDRVASGFSLDVKSTFQLVEALKTNQLPALVMINTHPERWDDNVLPWLRQLVMQNIKNTIKRLIVKRIRRRP